MALDGILLSKIIPGIQEVLPAKVQKIYQVSAFEVLFQIHGSKGRQQLMISCHSQYNRMLLSHRNYPTPDEPSNFIMLLRKYLEGSVILSVEQAGLDRWCTFHIKGKSLLGDDVSLQLVVELMGKYANVILVNDQGIIMDALKRIPPFENIRRIIQPGAVFRPTPPQEKRSPFKEPYIEEGKTLVQQFAGFSPFLAKEAEYRMAHGQSFESIMQEIKDSKELFIASNHNEAVFHCIALTSIGPCRSYPLFDGLDILYYHKEEKERIRQISGDIYHIVNKELKHQTTKLPRLLKEYDDAKDCDRWKKYGELLYAWQVSDTKGQKEIVLNDYETGQDITIPLDPRLDGKGNARRCYSRYSKYKKGQVYLQEQIAITQNEISYFQGLLEQLDLADFATAQGIKEELIKGGYLEEKKRHARKKKQEAPAVHEVMLANGVKLLYGRNNLQNETLTWHKAKKNDTWLHAKDYHGSHVVIQSEDPDEETLRFAANLAAYFSKGRDSSSVPVNYTLVRTLKKIPGAKPGMVQLGKYRTIYIDPDPEALRAAGVDID